MQKQIEIELGKIFPNSGIVLSGENHVKTWVKTLNTNQLNELSTMCREYMVDFEAKRSGTGMTITITLD